jgi:hypothetical protein
LAGTISVAYGTQATRATNEKFKKNWKIAHEQTKEGSI